MMKNRYNSPAPTWLRVCRDTWNTFGTGAILYLPNLNLPQHTSNLLIFILGMVGILFTAICIGYKSAASKDDI